jgi:hypothetical protein
MTDTLKVAESATTPAATSTPPALPSAPASGLPPAPAVPLDLASGISKEEREYLAYHVAEKAREQVTNWAKWVITPIAIVLALLGTKTYFDLESKINDRVTEEIERSRQQSRQVLAQFDVEKEKELAAFKQHLQKESDAVHDAAAQRIQAFKIVPEDGNRLTTPRTSIPPASATLDTSAGAIEVCIHEAGAAQILPGQRIGCAAELLKAAEPARTIAVDIQRVAVFMESKFGLASQQPKTPIKVTLHYGTDYNNAFWDGNQLVLGDGDGKLFSTFADPEIYGHNLVLRDFQRIGKSLGYESENGAIQMHVADIASALYTQSTLGLRPSEADWKIGKQVIGPSAKARGYTCLHNMADPADKGSLAPQPTSYAQTNPTMDPHYSSGIPNLAFYRFAAKLDRLAWQDPWQVWRTAVLHLPERPTFAALAKGTLTAASERFGADSAEMSALREAWHSVGVTPK